METTGQEFLMKIPRMVRCKWRQSRERRQKAILSIAKAHPDAQVRARAQIIVALAREARVHDIIKTLLCSASLVYKVARCFLEDCEGAFADRREDNGNTVMTKSVRNLVWTMVAKTPRQFGHRRPTWTLELLARTLKERTTSLFVPEGRLTIAQRFIAGYLETITS
jgi:hypothetical protein